MGIFWKHSAHSGHQINQSVRDQFSSIGMIEHVELLPSPARRSSLLSKFSRFSRKRCSRDSPLPGPEPHLSRRYRMHSCAARHSRREAAPIPMPCDGRQSRQSNRPRSSKRQYQRQQGYHLSLPRRKSIRMITPVLGPEHPIRPRGKYAFQMIASRLVDYLPPLVRRKEGIRSRALFNPCAPWASTEENEGFLLRIKTEPFSFAFLQPENFSPGPDSL